MSQLRSGARQLEYKIGKFRGVNENADGDANLNNGEAAYMRNYRITDGGALKVRPGWKKAIPEFTPSSAIHEGFEKQATAVYKNGQEISFYESASVEDGAVVLSDLVDEYDMRNASARAAVNAYDECFFLIGETPYKYTKSTTATAVSGGTVCYVYGKPLTVDKGIVGLWSGTVAGQEVMLFARDNMLYSQQFDDNGEATVTAEIGEVDTTEHVEIFFFGDKVYVLDGSEYYSWDGTEFKTVEGYIPTVAVAVSPSGDGTLLEQLNTLANRFRVKFSGDGTSTGYKFNSGAPVVTASKVLINGEMLDKEDYSSAIDGSITFDTAPPSGSSNIVVEYAYYQDSTSTIFPSQQASTAGKQYNITNNGTIAGISSVTIHRGTSDLVLIDGEDYTVGRSGEDYTVTLEVPLQSGDTVIIAKNLITNRSRVVSMRYAEFFNGAADTRVFLYGDGSNKAIYSDVTNNGKPSAEYFPDLNEMQIGDANTPVTAMIRHHNRLLAFKKGGGAYSVYYAQLSLADGSLTAGFYISNINKTIGCDRYDGATLVLNNPRTLEKGTIYEWQATSRSGNITLDQRNAEVVSEKVRDTLRSFDMETAMTYYDVRRHEYYCIYNGTAVVNNTAAKAWYVYTDFPATCMVEYDGKLYFGTADGLICQVDESFTSDEGSKKIDAKWESGTLDFGRPNDLKYTPKVWVSAMPKQNAKISAGIETDRNETASAVLDFNENRDMAMTLKANLKARKFTHYKLKLAAKETGGHATVISAVIKASYDIPERR